MGKQIGGKRYESERERGRKKRERERERERDVEGYAGSEWGRENKKNGGIQGDS